MADSDILGDIIRELKQLKKNHSWPEHIVSASGIVTSNAGAITSSCIELKYKSKEDDEQEIKKQIRSHAIRTAASAIRLIENLK